MSAAEQEIFRSESLLARLIAHPSSSICVVTFDSYTDNRTLDRVAFGEGFLARSGIDAIHVIARNNEWYLHPEMTDLAAAIAARLDAYDTRIAYGSSMGGYAAIRFGGMVGASAAIAISPQFSIDPAVAPFEYRWAEAALLDFALERERETPFVEAAFVIYDPCGIDRRHVDLYRPHTHVVDIAIPYSGHPASGYLSQTGLLSSAVLDIVHGRLDAAALVRTARSRRRQSVNYFFGLAERARHAPRRVALSAAALALSNDEPVFAAHHAWRLAEAGHEAQARALFDQILGQAADHPVIHYRYAEFLEHVGEVEQAIAALDRLIAIAPNAATYRARRERLARSLVAHTAQDAPIEARRWFERAWPFSRRR